MAPNPAQSDVSGGGGGHEAVIVPLTLPTQSTELPVAGAPAMMEPNNAQSEASEGRGRHKAVIGLLTLPKDADAWDNETRGLLKHNKAITIELEQRQSGTSIYDQKVGQGLDKQCNRLNLAREQEIAPILQAAFDKIEEDLAGRARRDAIRRLHAAQRNTEKLLRIKILRHTTKECYELASNLHAKLVFDLREQIYLHVIEAKEEVVAEDVKSFFIRRSGITTNYRRKYEYDVKACLNVKFLPLCIRPEYVGRTVAEEASQVFYKWRNPGLYRYCMGDLRYTLARDYLSLKIDPTEFLRALTITVAGWTDKNDKGKITLSLRNISTGGMVSGALLEPLRQLMLKNNFRLYIEVKPKYSLSPLGINKEMVASQLQPMYDELIAGGMIVEIVLC